MSWDRYGDDIGRGSRGTYGTEQDPVNCSFFLRIGACRHGANCPKKHTWPAFSTVVLFEHLWIAPKKVLARQREKEEHYENFCEDILEECLKFGEVEAILTFANMGDHMIGNTFVRFADEDQAAACIAGVNGRYYAGRKVSCKYSPVTDFDNAKCRDHQSNDCKRGQFCNFAHFMPIPRWVHSVLKADRYRRPRRTLAATTTTSSSRRKRDGWPAFPIGGLRPERMECIRKWNELRAKEGKPVKVFKELDEPTSSLKLYKPGTM